MQEREYGRHPRPLAFELEAGDGLGFEIRLENSILVIWDEHGLESSCFSNNNTETKEVYWTINLIRVELGVTVE